MLNNQFCQPQSSKSKVRLHLFHAVKNMLVSILVFCFISAAAIPSALSAQETPAPDTQPSSSESASTGFSDIPTELLDPVGDGAPEIDGKAYVLYDMQSGVFLLGKDQDTPLSPASITKVMTVLLAFEKLNMTDTITVTRDMYESIPNDYVRLGLVEGEEITVEEAVYSCLLISANDAAMALAITMGGSVEGFSAMMDEKAVELGCKHSHFTNPYGFSDPDHVTTAHDMALILAEALKYEMYTKISTTANYTIPATNKFDESRGLTNGNRFVSTTTYAYENYIGGKTGVTDLSGHTIVAGARQNGRTLIGVILGASHSEIRYANLIDLFTYGFEKYKTTGIDPAEYTALQEQTVNQVISGIAGAGYSLEITDVALSLNPYCTTLAAKSDTGYSTGIDVSQAVIKADLSQQVLVMPVYRQYSDNTKDQVGTLSITLCDPQTAETASEAAAESKKPKTDIKTILIRAGIIFVLVCILALCITIYVMLQKEKKRKRSRRRPRVL